MSGMSFAQVSDFSNVMDPEPVAVNIVLGSNDALTHGEEFVCAEHDYGRLTQARGGSFDAMGSLCLEGNLH